MALPLPMTVLSSAGCRRAIQAGTAGPDHRDERWEAFERGEKAVTATDRRVITLFRGELPSGDRAEVRFGVKTDGSIELSRFQAGPLLEVSPASSSAKRSSESRTSTACG